MIRSQRYAASMQWRAAAAVVLLGFVMAGGSESVRAQDLDVNAVFWCDAGKKTGEQTEAECIASREALLNNCTTCHAITPFVKAQKDKRAWSAFMRAHRERLPNVDDDVYLGIEKFLQGHFNPQNPVPQLPPALEAMGVPPA